MPVSKSMDFPGAKKSTYADQVVQTQTTSSDTLINYIPVPGPQGPAGVPGPIGLKDLLEKTAVRVLKARKVQLAKTVKMEKVLYPLLDSRLVGQDILI
jgi:hypothetical protein